MFRFSMPANVSFKPLLENRFFHGLLNPTQRHQERPKKTKTYHGHFPSIHEVPVSICILLPVSFFLYHAKKLLQLSNSPKEVSLPLCQITKMRNQTGNFDCFTSQSPSKSSFKAFEVSSDSCAASGCMKFTPR